MYNAIVHAVMDHFNYHRTPLLDGYATDAERRVAYASRHKVVVTDAGPCLFITLICHDVISRTHPEAVTICMKSGGAPHCMYVDMMRNTSFPDGTPFGYIRDGGRRLTVRFNTLAEAKLLLSKWVPGSIEDNAHMWENGTVEQWLQANAH